MPVESTTLPSRTEPLSSVVLISIDLYMNREYRYEHAPTRHTEYITPSAAAESGLVLKTRPTHLCQSTI